VGDLCDMNDVDRFMRSKQGKAHLGEITRALKGKVIADVTFSNEVWGVKTTLHLADGTTFEAVQSEHEVDTLRELFTEAIQAEYDKDYPERKVNHGNT